MPQALLQNPHQAPKPKVINALIDLKTWEDNSEDSQKLIKVFDNTNQRHDYRHAGESTVELNVRPTDSRRIMRDVA